VTRTDAVTTCYLVLTAVTAVYQQGAGLVCFHVSARCHYSYKFIM